ncbi:MAG TPA: Gfo/Idh/MocA family oxidoreductase [Candidatus Dormibacteraeota bacterium]|nr:Gfo/Idh/MocA family oxidoreductase [Candidatus Dormibacteraeota bacterium]
MPPRPTDGPSAALVIGHGYAGSRFTRVLRHLGTRRPRLVRLAGVCDVDPARLAGLEPAVPVFTSAPVALAALRPDVVVVAVSEARHVEVLSQLRRAPSVRLVLCEKPLTVEADETRSLRDLFERVPLSLNLLERHSECVASFQDWWSAHQELQARRVEFFWGKHRIGDRRPSIGVLSELIHPLDLVDFLFGPWHLRVSDAHGSRSDFSHANGPILDAVDVILDAGGIPVVGHASFVWPRRMRTVTAVLAGGGRTFRATLELDAPHWDCDTLRIEAVDRSTGRLAPCHEYRSRAQPRGTLLEGVDKLRTYIERSLASLAEPSPSPALVGFEQAYRLQLLLESVAAALVAGGRPAVAMLRSDPPSPEGRTT